MSEDYTINGKCPEVCGKCCTAILPLSDHEINKIKKYIKRNNIECHQIENESDYEKICPFLDDNMSCKIYVHRPEVCSYFMCNGSKSGFHHRDKKIIDMYTEFYPEIHVGDVIKINKLNDIYQQTKAEANII